jgi:hydrogenase maturation factor
MVEEGDGGPLMHEQEPLQAGKLPAPLLARLFAELPTEDPHLLLGPAVGEDAAVIDFPATAELLLVAKTDPVTFATDEIGYYAVNVCANDLAVTGAVPRFYLPTVLLPAGHTDHRLAAQVFRQIGDACRAICVTVAGGHSEVTPTVNQPVVAGAMLGEVDRDHLVPSGACRVGDLVLVVGEVPVEGTSIIAREMRDLLLTRGWDPAMLDQAVGFLYDPGISVLAPARLAADWQLITAMHDPTEGGIITGLFELATAAELGLEIDLDSIPVSAVGRQLCEEFGLDPLGTIASGALLATAPPHHIAQLEELWDRHGFSSAVIGRVLPRHEGLIAVSGGHRCQFPHFEVDEITRLWA